MHLDLGLACLGGCVPPFGRHSRGKAHRHRSQCSPSSSFLQSEKPWPAPLLRLPERHQLQLQLPRRREHCQHERWPRRGKRRRCWCPVGRRRCAGYHAATNVPHGAGLRKLLQDEHLRAAAAGERDARMGDVTNMIHSSCLWRGVVKRPGMLRPDRDACCMDDVG